MNKVKSIIFTAVCCLLATSAFATGQASRIIVENELGRDVNVYSYMLWPGNYRIVSLSGIL